MQEDSNLLAILGPTNTGKTYLAFERLISYKSGIFGFPLRLLARENYDKAVVKLGHNKVALITGEEKILPKDAKYYFCTVESMPLNISVECIAIDEIQLSADYDRGHIFTDRLINLRGIYETIFLGSLTIENILLDLFSKIKIQKRNRFSNLSFLPKQSLSKLSPRSAIIAFNVNSVYEIAESLRMHRGGAAVVLGSLSPRTRNAQVEVYEDKKVDFLVSTDAIGMGLNLNINHVSFSALQKFDGRYKRDLSASELGQIAGRAGRYLNDGTFGYLKTAGNLDPMIIKKIEDHKFDSIQKIYWRNSNIDFSSAESVLNSFKKFPVKNFFILKKNAEDEINFKALSEDIKIKKHLNNSDNIRMLWEVCRIPDFQKIFNDTYIELLKNIFITLMNNHGTLNEKWLEERILKLDNYDGGIEELSIKISNIRTWTYIANQSKWISDYDFWQKKTHQIENNLSDHLHASLSKRFIDNSASFFVDTENRGEKPIIKVNDKKSIELNGQNYGYINGFDLELNIPKSESLFSLNHVKKSIRNMIEEKINNFLQAPLESINFGEIQKVKISDNVKIYWGDEPIAILIKGNDVFSPRVETLNTEFLQSDKKIIITKKLQEWLNNKITNTLKPLTESIEETISSEVRAFVFNIYLNLGTMPIDQYFQVTKNLNVHDRSSISKLGIRIGAKFFFMPNLLKKLPMEINAILWKVYNSPKEDDYFPLPNDGRVSFINNSKISDTYWLAIGYIRLKNFLIRVDVFEKIFYLARQKYKYGPFVESADLMNPVGCNSEQLESILLYCGFNCLNLFENKKLFFYKIKKNKKITRNKINEIKTSNLKNRKKIKNILIKKDIKSYKNNEKKVKNILIKNDTKSDKKNEKIDPNSPFAVLEKLL